MPRVNTADLRLAGVLRFEAHTGGGHDFAIDTSGSGGEDTAAGPVDLVLSAACACMAMDAVSILRKMRQDISSYEVHADGARAAEHPRVLTSIDMTHTVRGRDLDPAQVARALQLSLSRYCPVHAMLAPAVAFTVRYDVTDESDGSRTTGEVVPEAEGAVEA